MSSRRLLLIMALTSILVVPGTATQITTAGDSIAELLLRDEIDRAEAALKSASRSASTVAFQGEIEYRRGHFDKAQELYRSALQMNEKTGRAHFGIGKLAMAKLKAKDALKS